MIEGVDTNALSQWMETQGFGSAPIRDVTPLGGGTQNVVVRLTHADRDFVLKRGPIRRRSDGNDAIRREISCLKALAGSAVPHPALLLACIDDHVLGGPFYLTELADGFNPTEIVPEPHRSNVAVQRDLGFSMIDAMVSLSKVNPDINAPGRRTTPDRWRQAQPIRWRDQLQGYLELDGYNRIALIDVDRVTRWLLENVPAQGVSGMVHGDFRLGNTLVDRARGKIVAVIDWELASFGDPLLDLAHFLVSLAENHPPGSVSVLLPSSPMIGFPTEGELAARYEELSGRAIDDLPWFTVLAAFRMAVLLEGTHARAAAGQASTQLGAEFHQLANEFMEQATRRADI